MGLSLSTSEISTSCEKNDDVFCSESIINNQSINSVINDIPSDITTNNIPSDITTNNIPRDITTNNTLTKINMRKKFIERLNLLGHDGYSICDLLIPDKCVISGSFAMQVITKDSFKDSDIDIFTFNDDSIKIKLLSNGYTIKTNTIKNETYKKGMDKDIEKKDIIKIESYKKDMDKLKTYKEGLGKKENGVKQHKIKNVTTYYKEGVNVPVQVILINDDTEIKTYNVFMNQFNKNIENSLSLRDECIKNGYLKTLKNYYKKTEPASMNDYIKNYFDLDFCKIIFDGNYIIKCDNGSIDNRKCKFSLSQNKKSDLQMDATWKRIKKYVNRGYCVEITN